VTDVDEYNLTPEEIAQLRFVMEDSLWRRLVRSGRVNKALRKVTPVPDKKTPENDEEDDTI
jgi:hypothetical protein